MQDLVQAASKGDREAFAALASASIDRLFAVARRILQDQELAQDAVQSALLAAWRDLASLKDPTRFEQWLHRILVRSCYAEARRQRAFRVRLRVVRSEPAISDASRALADRDELERGFRHLSIEQRTVVVLHFYVGLPLKEVAQVIGVPEGTARSRLHYALRAMRVAIETEAGAVLAGGRVA